MATNTVATKQTHTAANNASGNTSGPYTISFDYLLESDVEVRVDNTLKTQTTHYTFPSKTSIQFTSGNFPTAGVTIEIKRNTDITVPKVDFQDGSVLTESDLDNNSKHLLFGMQETKEDTESLVSTFVSANAPTGISNGARWYDSVSGRTFVYYVDTDTAQWVEASPPFDATEFTSNITNTNVAANAAIDSTKLSFTQTGAGAVARTVDSKLEDIVSVKDFGATGDGSTDDAVAIQAAIDSVSSGGIIFFPKGTYIIGTSLGIRSDNTLVGANRYDSVLKTKAGTDITLINDGSAVNNRICITDLGFNGNKANVSAGQIINLWKTEDFLVSNCRIVDSKGDAMIIRQCSYGQIVNNNIVSPDVHGISLTNTDAQGNDIQIIGNSIKNPGASGINVSESNNVTVTGNSVRHTGSPTNGYGGVRFANNTTRCVAGNNAIQGMSRGIFVVTTAGAYNTIDGNVINDSGIQGILIQASYQLVTDNTVIDSGKVTNPSSGIELSGSAQIVQIQNNQIIGTSSMDIGVEVSSTGHRNVITGNSIIANTGDPITNSGSGRNFFRHNHYGTKDTGSGVSSIAAASTITLPPDGEIFNITDSGTTTIGTINGIWTGRTVKLRFAAVGTVVTDSSSIRLSGNFTSDGGGDVLTLIGMGDPTVIIYEVSRSNV